MVITARLLPNFTHNNGWLSSILSSMAEEFTPLWSPLREIVPGRGVIDAVIVEGVGRRRDITPARWPFIGLNLLRDGWRMHALCLTAIMPKLVQLDFCDIGGRFVVGAGDETLAARCVFFCCRSVGWLFPVGGGGVWRALSKHVTK